MLVVGREPDPPFNPGGRALLDPLTAVLAVVGVVVAFSSLRRPASSLILLWLAVPLFFGTVLAGETHYSTRSLAAAPAIALLAAIGLDRLASLAQRTAQRRLTAVASGRWRQVAAAAIVVLVGLVGGLGIHRYYEVANDPEAHHVSHPAALEWSRFLASRGPVAVTVIAPIGFPGEYATLFAPNARVCNGRWYDAWQSCPPAQFLIFDQDPTDADRYGQLTDHVVLPGASDDSVTRYWYVSGPGLADPSLLLGP
jgi:hypothetical protein